MTLKCSHSDCVNGQICEATGMKMRISKLNMKILITRNTITILYTITVMKNSYI